MFICTFYRAAVVCMVSGAGLLSVAEFVNGGFESGNLDGWNREIRGGTVLLEDATVDSLSNMPFSLFEEVPLMAPMLDTNQHYTAVQGQYFLRIPGNAATPIMVEYEGAHYDIDLSQATTVVWQDVEVNEGGTLSGLIALWTVDLPKFIYDHAFVHIAGNGVDDTAASIRIADLEWDTTGPPPYTPNQSEWRYWEWTAPATGTYRVELSNTMDDQMESDAYFDLNRVCIGSPVAHHMKNDKRTPRSIVYNSSSEILRISGLQSTQRARIAVYAPNGTIFKRLDAEKFALGIHSCSVPLKTIFSSFAAQPVIVRIERDGSEREPGLLLTR